jgi:hypothetical protein
MIRKRRVLTAIPLHDVTQIFILHALSLFLFCVSCVEAQAIFILFWGTTRSFFCQSKPTEKLPFDLIN